MGAKQEAEGWGATRVRWGPPGGCGWRRGARERAGRGDPGLRDVERGSSAAGCTGPGPRDRSENCRLGEPLKRTGRQAGLGDRATSSVYRQETEAHRGGAPPLPAPSPRSSASSGPSETNSETGPSGRRVRSREARPGLRARWGTAEGAEPGPRLPSRQPRWALGDSVSWWL